MTDFTSIRVERDDHRPVVRVTLCRPDVGNAVDASLLGELRQLLYDLRNAITDDPVSAPRVMVITGDGDAFCVGPHVDQLRQQVGYSYEANTAEAQELAGLLNDLYTLPVATIARVNGMVIGSAGIGLVCCSDMAIAADSAMFGFNELRLGLVPAVAGPFVIRRIGERNAREAMLTGAPMTAAHAERVGLVQQAVDAEELDTAVEQRVGALLACGPEAIRACKELIAHVTGRPLEEVTDYTVDTFSRVRMSDEGREGMTAALEERSPKWDPGWQASDSSDEPDDASDSSGDPE